MYETLAPESEWKQQLFRHYMIHSIEGIGLEEKIG
jgi:hypothetical protein